MHLSSVMLSFVKWTVSVTYRLVTGASWNKGDTWFSQQHLNQDRNQVSLCVYTPANP
jgi:hypothetical protein